MANISISFQNGIRPVDTDRVLLNFKFDEHELNNQYLVKCFYKRIKKNEPEEWLLFNEFRVNTDKLLMDKEIQFNFVKDTPFQQDIAFKCELYLLISEYISKDFSLR